MTSTARNRTVSQRALAWLAYPITLSLAIVLFLWLEERGVSAQSAAYIAGTAAAVMVTLLEFGNPHLLSWQGRWLDVRSDLLYMVFVQTLLPVFLRFTLSIWILRTLQSRGWEPSALWPHDWPIGIQVALMLVVADFLRYWLHVAAHHNIVLWRLHAVHHSPDRLYWLNVGRFHPAEKFLQFLLDTLPFILIGVSEQVIALYFVFYATNGFFQHSNVELRFGPLNYLISSAELHRWHHSRLPEESNHNYGNNLIIWDLLFRTRYLPQERDIVDIGLPNRHYPMAFLAQFKAPLIRGMEQQQHAPLRWQEIALNALVWFRVTYTWHTKARKLFRTAENPEKIQSMLLQAILDKNCETAFGQSHDFASIKSVEDYRTRVPVHEYEDLRSYIENQEREETPQLTIEPPILYARTSGTTGKAKIVPITESALQQLRDTQRIFASVQFRAAPEAYYGRYLVIASPAIEGRLRSGRPFGSASGQLYRSLPRPVRAKYLLPWQLFDIEDYDLKYLLIVRLALVEKNVTLMASANPSTFLKLVDTITAHRVELLADIRAGGFSRASRLPPKVREALQGRWTCAAERLEELEELLAEERPRFAALWPYLGVLTTWTSGSCRTALQALRPLLPPQVVIVDPGYVSSEFRGSITVDITHELGLPTLTENFFEFVDVAAWERGLPRFLSLHEITEGCDYYVIVTTETGLYRYFINDIVRVTGRYRSTPTIQFVQKGKGVTSITGEKLYEGQVVEAVNSVATEQELLIVYFVILADVEHSMYQLFVEFGDESRIPGCDFVTAIERRLGELNIEYREKRASGRLRPLEWHRLRAGAREAFKRSRLDAGQREGQFKDLMLAYKSDLGFNFAEYVDQD